MNSKRLEIYAVKPGAIVLMHDRKAIGVVMGKYRDLTWYETSVTMYLILWTNRRGKTELTRTFKPESWIQDVITHAKLS